MQGAGEKKISWFRVMSARAHAFPRLVAFYELVDVFSSVGIFLFVPPSAGGVTPGPEASVLVFISALAGSAQGYNATQAAESVAQREGSRFTEVASLAVAVALITTGVLKLLTVNPA